MFTRVEWSGSVSPSSKMWDQARNWLATSSSNSSNRHFVPVPAPHPFSPPFFPQDINHSKYVLTPEAEAYLTAGSPEAQLFAAVPPGEGLALAAAKASLPQEVSDVGFRQAMQQKWVALDKSGAEPRIVRKVGGWVP